MEEPTSHAVTQIKREIPGGWWTLAAHTMSPTSKLPIEVIAVVSRDIWIIKPFSHHTKCLEYKHMHIYACAYVHTCIHTYIHNAYKRTYIQTN